MELDASIYSFSQDIYRVEFEILLSKFVICYQMMITEHPSLPRNENGIRDFLSLNYLKNNDKRKLVKLNDYLFERESPEDHSVGRTDIKVQSHRTFTQQEAYYIIECKLIDSNNLRGTSGLNAKYIVNGICRFTSGYYHTSSDNVNGMIGFVVDKMNIDKNIENINHLMNVELKNSDKELVCPNVIQLLKRSTFIPSFDYQYTSTHFILDTSREITLYHLMLDYSKNIAS